MNNQTCCGHCSPIPPNYPFNRPARDSYTFCCCGRVPDPPSSKFPTNGPFVGSGFVLNDTNPYLVDTTYTSYGQVLCFSESVITKVTQRKDPSCINLAATFDMTDTNLTNTVRNSFLEKYIAKKYTALQGVLPIIKNETKFKVYYTITDVDGGVVYEGTAVSTSQDNHFHFTDIRDMYVVSARNVIIENIPAMTYQGMYTVTINKVEAYVNVVDTKSHLQDDLNPYYAFCDNNMKIQLQHDIINAETSDDEIMIASCEVNKSFDYVANVTTRLRMTFTAFMSTIIASGDTTGVWEALNSPTEEIITELRNELSAVEDDIKSLHEIIEQQNLLIQKLSGQIDINTNNIKTHAESINDLNTKINDYEERITALEAIPLATVSYKEGTEFVKGQITWSEYGELYQVTENYTATGDMNADITAGKLVAINKDVTSLEESVSNNTTMIDTLQASQSEMTSSISELETSVSSNSETLTDHESRITALEGTSET
jgi:hypothetical protein